MQLKIVFIYLFILSAAKKWWKIPIITSMSPGWTFLKSLLLSDQQSNSRRYIRISVTLNREKQQILTFDKHKSDNLWTICLIYELKWLKLKKTSQQTHVMVTELVSQKRCSLSLFTLSLSAWGEMTLSLKKVPHCEYLCVYACTCEQIYVIVVQIYSFYSPIFLAHYM